MSTNKYGIETFEQGKHPRTLRKHAKEQSAPATREESEAEVAPKAKGKGKK